MLLRKRVKGGILLYALLMSAIFTLILQFYLGRVIALERQQAAQLSATRAYLIAHITREVAHQTEGSLQFEEGDARYKVKGKQLRIDVTLQNGQLFNYDLAIRNRQNTNLQKEETNEKSSDSSKALSMSEPNLNTDERVEVNP